AGVAGAQINNAEAVRFSAIGDDEESIARPHFVASGVLRISQTADDLLPLRRLDLGAQRSFVEIFLHAFPGQPCFHSVAEIAPRFPSPAFRTKKDRASSSIAAVSMLVVSTAGSPSANRSSVT